MWWNGLPGTTSPADDDTLADQEVALACAARFKPVRPQDGGSATTDTETEAAEFLDWLHQARNDTQQRRIRRLALCAACEDPRGGSRGDILGAAERLRQNLTPTS
jgi:hypothetical protein